MLPNTLAPLAVAACSAVCLACPTDAPGPSAPASTYVAGPLAVLSPAHGAIYDDGPPAIIAVVDPDYSAAERAAVVATVNGVDVSDRWVDDGDSMVVTGLGDVLADGGNSVTVTFGEATHRIDFTYACGGSCGTPKPVLSGPMEAVEGSQSTLFGEHLGGPGDDRVLYVDGVAMQWRGGHFAQSVLVFIAPPAGMGEVDVEVEVNGVRSDPMTVTLTAAEPLAASDDDVIADFVSGIRAMSDVVRAFPVTSTGDAETDAKVAALRAALQPELDAMVDDVDARLSALPAEAKAYYAQFLAQGSLDTLLSGWASDVPTAPKADEAPAGFSGQCEGDILRVYRVVAFFKVVQDALNGAALAVAFVAVLYPPAALWAPVLLEAAAAAGQVIGVLQLFISMTLPDIAGATLDLPEIVARDQEVEVTATVTFVYDPAKKSQEIMSWSMNSAVGATIDAGFAALGQTGISEALLNLGKQAVDRTWELANHLGAYASDVASGDKPAPEGFTLPAYAPYLDFDADRFEIVGDGPSAACTATGRWKAEEECDVADEWVLGNNLVATGWYDAVFSGTLASGTVKSADSPVAGTNLYDDDDYGAWLEKFGRDAGCSRMEYCWVQYGPDGTGCLVSALGPDGDCAGMYLGFCPSHNDYQNALLRCQLCFESGI